MPTPSPAIRLMLEAIRAMRETGYTREDVQGLAGDVLEHLEANGHQPYGFGHCTNCHRLIIGWSAYQWFILVASRVPRAASPRTATPYIAYRTALYVESTSYPLEFASMRALPSAHSRCSTATANSSTFSPLM